MCVNIIYVCICLYCVICLILYYRSLLICTNKEFMNLTKLYPVVVNIVVLRNTSHFFLILIYFRFYLTLCPAKRSLFYIPNFKINFLKIKRKIGKKGFVAVLGYLSTHITEKAQCSSFIIKSE